MRMSTSSIVLSTLWLSMSCLEMAYAKPVVNKFSQTQNGKVPEALRNELTQDVTQAKSNMTQEHYAEVVADPQQARNDQERLAGLSAREIIVLVDRSGSMGNSDENPTGKASPSWTRWDSARVATESIAEVAISMDRDSTVDVLLWTGDNRGGLIPVDSTITNCGQIAALFSQNQPNGTTPLSEALEHVYSRKLKGMLDRGEPFTVIIMTDGAPNDQGKVKQFFKKVIKDNRLEAPGRETLAAFSFVRMGDDDGAKTFLGDLDDNLISQLSVNVDIVDTKEDNFLFGTGSYKGSDKTGPFALFWDAIYD